MSEDNERLSEESLVEAPLGPQLTEELMPQHLSEVFFLDRYFGAYLEGIADQQLLFAVVLLFTISGIVISYMGARADGRLKNFEIRMLAPKIRKNFVRNLGFSITRRMFIYLLLGGVIGGPMFSALRDARSLYFLLTVFLFMLFYMVPLVISCIKFWAPGFYNRIWLRQQEVIHAKTVGRRLRLIKK